MTFFWPSPHGWQYSMKIIGGVRVVENVKTTRSGIQPLLPDDFGDEALAGIKFGEEFGNRYGELKLDLESNWSQRTEMLIQAKFPGHPHPQFFPGSLEDALGEACNKYVVFDILLSFSLKCYCHIFYWVKTRVSYVFLIESSLLNLRPTSERRMLAVYLHHDSSVLTNVFCTQVTCQ